MYFGPNSRNLIQQITYWPPSGMSGDGFPTFGAPELLNGRWAPTSALVRDSKGDNINVHTAVTLSGDVEEEGYLAEGDYTGATEGQPEVTEPTTLPNAYQIKSFSSAPDLRTLEQLRTAYCG